MKTSKELDNLRLDVIRLANKYSKESFVNRILLASINYYVEFLKWINDKHTAKSLAWISNPIVLETFKFLETLRLSHPEGISKPEFVKYFVGTKNTKFLPTILSFAKISESEHTEILKPYENIFANASIFSGIDEKDIISVKKALSEIESEFKKHTETLINKPFGNENVINKKNTLTKDDKKRELFNFLISQVNDQIAKSLDKYGFDVVATEVRSNSMFMVDVEAIKRNRLIVDKRNYSYITIQAKDLAKTILNRIDSSDHEYNYNLMVNTAMRFNMVMKDEDYDKYFYELSLDKARGSVEQIKRVNFQENAWLHPNVVAFLFITLTLIMSQIKF